MKHEEFMRGLSVQHLRFTVRPLESIVFGDQSGPALRGALYQALSENFCSEREGPITPDHQSRCPVCWLLAAEDDQAKRGHDIPRPLTVEPPTGHLYHRDERFTFGFTLIGRAQNLFPYLARAVQKMGNNGIGKGRGRFKLEMISEYTPLLDTKRDLMSENMVQQPTLQITSSRVQEAAVAAQPEYATLKLLTPLRLIAADRLVKCPDPPIFIQRLFERCQSLVTYYAETDSLPPRESWLEAMVELKEHATQLVTAYDDTEWLDAWSGSRRNHQYTPIGGLVGVFRWEGDLTALRPWLLWGQSLHVGKDAVKGNGWYQVMT
jgi:hypothetical protein